MSGTFALDRHGSRKTIDLTTIGRRSGKPRTVTIWFVSGDDGSVLVQHVARKAAHWYRNLCANPSVQVDFGDGPIEARARPLEDAQQIADVMAKVGKKYWTYRIVRLFGGNAADAVAARIEPL